MAAEVLAQAGCRVDVYDAMASAGRKFLMAGKGGLNLTHAEPTARFVERYGCQRDRVAAWLARFGVAELRAWAEALGVATFVGSSGRVFPRDMKAAPLLRAWLHRLRQAGVRFHMRHRWLGWSAAAGLDFETPAGPVSVPAVATVLALGGGSWARLGSTGAWVPLLAGRGVPVRPLRPANCGFDVGWSEHFRQRFAGQPVKSVAAEFEDAMGERQGRAGEMVITATGIEGSLVYALSAGLRDTLEAAGSVQLHLDLLPDKSPERVLAEVAHPRGARSLSSHLQSRVGIAGVKAGLLREVADRQTLADPAVLSRLLKALPLRLLAPRPLDEAISSAGGVDFAGLDHRLMLTAMPSVFCAGEMLDWEAPTGGYLLTACFASGRVAAEGLLAWLAEQGDGAGL
jgi:hypothetical protein